MGLKKDSCSYLTTCRLSNSFLVDVAVDVTQQ